MGSTQGETVAAKLWFKVVSAGESCSGGDHKWSLPTAAGPGEWHEIDGSPVLCQTGFHVTEQPAYWMDQGRTVYVAEIDGEVSGPRSGQEDPTKVSAKRCRLIRLATDAELVAVGIYTAGEHRLPESAKSAHASGSATVKAYGSATVKAYDSATVEASDSATVKAYGSATVEASGSATVIVARYGKTSVTLSGRAAEISWASGWAEFRRASGPAGAA